MPIEIDGRTPAPTGGTGERAPVRAAHDEAAAKTQQNASAASNADTFTLTDRAGFLQRLHAAIAALPVADEHRVESIRQKIDSGSYAVDPERVAEKLIQTELALTRGSQNRASMD